MKNHSESSFRKYRILLQISCNLLHFANLNFLLQFTILASHCRSWRIPIFCRVVNNVQRSNTMGSLGSYAAMTPITLADGLMTNSSQCRYRARTHRRHFNCRPTMTAKRHHCCAAGHSTSNLYKSILLYQGRQKHVGQVRRPLARLARPLFFLFPL